VPGQAQQKIQYPLDAVNSGVASVTRGTPGLFGDNSQSVLSLANPSQAQPGGSIQLLNRSLTQNYPTVHVYGFSNQSYGPLTLPLDLTPFGAPGNQLENALDLIVLTQASAGGRRLERNVQAGHPDGPRLRRARALRDQHQRGPERQ
jgi:hypothetical protein